MFDIKKIQQALTKAGMDGWLFYQFHDLDPMADRILHLPAGRMSSRRWFYWVPAGGEPVRLVHAIESAALDEVPGKKQLYVGWRQMEQALKEILSGQGKVAMQYSPGNAIPYISRVDAGTVELVRSCGPEVVSSADLVQVFEAVMDDAQEASHMEASRILPEIVMEAYGEVARAVRAGKPRSEYEIQQFIMEKFAAHEMETHHPPIVAVDAHAGDPHFEVPETGSALITEGTFLLTDIWAKFSKPRSIYADITWTGYVGTDVPAEHAKIFDIVRRARVAAQDHVIAACSAGRDVRGWEADDACRAVVREAGYEDRFLHRTGHSIGEEVHGNGANVDNLETRDERLLLPRTCFSVEPGIYLENFGVRSEVNMIIHGDGSAQVSGREQDAVVPILAL
jgi:Xaa-Pro dipeptidase